MRKSSIWILGLIMLIALVLRAWGLYWGAPQRVDLHPDEFDFVMKHALALMDRIGHAVNNPAEFDRRTFDPGFLNYPGFIYYLIALVGGILRKTGVLKEVWETYLVGRGIVVLFGVAAVPIVYLTALELDATEIGALLGALWMALLPLHVWESHTATTDVLMTFWVAVTLYASLRLLRVNGWRDFAFAGISLGLAVGAKYTAAIASVAIIAGALASRRPLAQTLPKLFFCGVLSLAACFLVTPYSFIRFKDTLTALNHEHYHTLSHHYGFCVYAMGWWFRRWIYQLVAAWPFSLGFALYASCAAGTIWALVRFDRKMLVLFSFAAVFFYVTGSWTFTPLRYYLPLFVIGVTLAGKWMGDWIASPSAARRRLALAAVAVTVVYTSIFTCQTVARFRNDTRMQAGRWLDETAQPGSTILVFGWHRYLGEPKDMARFDFRYMTEDLLKKTRAEPSYDLLEISSLSYQRHYRHGNWGYVVAYDRLRDPKGPFELVKKFESHFINKHLYMKLDPMFEGYFVSPTIEFYRSKAVHTPPA